MFKGHNSAKYHWLSYDPWTCIFVQILSCPDFCLTSFDILIWYLVFGYIWMSYSLSSNFVKIEWFFAGLWLLNLYFLFKFEVQVNKSKEVKKKSGQLKIWTKNTSSMAITQPKVIRPERNSSLNCNSYIYSQIPNIKSIYQRTSKKSPENFKFEQKIQVQEPQPSEKSFDLNKIRA
jgi:hypothetical protein